LSEEIRGITDYSPLAEVRRSTVYRLQPGLMAPVQLK